jgi:hypothetical protein
VHDVPPAGIARFRFVQTNYVAEEGATQMANSRALFADLRRKRAGIAAAKRGSPTPARAGPLDGHVPLLRPACD